MTSSALPARDRTLTAATIVLWAVAWSAWTADWLLEPMPFTGERALRRIPVCILGALICWSLRRPLAAVARQGLARRLVLALLISVAASLVQGGASELVFSIIAPRWDAASVRGWVLAAMTNFWVFAAWSALFFALDHDRAARDSRQALAQIHAELLEAQHLALVRQIDPHFLFNALNTVSGLIEEGQAERANMTTLALGRLLRSSMQRDLPAVRSLGAELAAQTAYLDVQAARFPDRFSFVDTVPADLRARPVPSLILQPLIENVFAHGVAQSERRVTLEVTAADAEGRLILVVRDDAQSGGRSAHQGAGIGLDNVRRRLQTLYAGRAAFASGPLAPCGWEAVVSLP